MHISKEAAGEKRELSIYDRKQMGLKARQEDDVMVSEILVLFAKKRITVDRACNVLKDVRTLLPHFAKLPYKEDSKCDS